MVLNCKISLQTDGKNLWPCIFPDYNSDSKHKFTTKESCLKQLMSEFEMISEMGFNTIRIVGIGELNFDKTAQKLSISASTGNEGHKEISFREDENYKEYFNAIRDLLFIASSNGLKVIFLIQTLPGYSLPEQHLIKFVSEFNSDSTILAYDFFNEPLYFDSLERKKTGPFEITSRWKKLMNKYAPNQLFTVGLAGVREVFEWDPNLLAVDFVSFHPYEYEPEQVMNETYWYGKYVKKPWIIGETGFPADDDSIPYTRQLSFARKTLKQVYNCGGSGYSWWQYKDVDWKVFYPNYLGVMSREGETVTKKGNLVSGKPKPITEAFREFENNGIKDSCVCMPNYYNYSGLNHFRLEGKLFDNNNNPIAGGVVLGWDENWVHSFYSVSKPDGSFELFGNFQYFHWMASATLFNMARGEVLPDSVKILSENLSGVNLGVLKLVPIKEIN